MAPRVAVLVTSRPCPRRALTIGQQRSPTDNHGRCPCSPTCSIRPSGAVRGSFPSSRCRADNPVRYSPRMSVEVEAVHQVTDELVEVAGRLLSQLSRSAAPFDADGLARIVGHQAITLFIARSGGVIVGMLTLVTFPLPSGLRARIEDVVVDQDSRGQGIGTALTMAAIDLAQQHGARSIDLTSRASRVAANRLYERLGFQLRDSNVYRYQPQVPAP